MQKYFIGEIGFKTKKECESYTRSIINELGSCQINKDNDKYKFFSDLIKNHSEYDEKVGNGIDYFYIQPNALNRKTFQTMIKRIDGSDIDFSWIYCCQFKLRSTTHHLNIAMRQSISTDIIKFKKSQSQLQCNHCQIMDIDYRDFHVDHNDPPFRTLKHNFLDLNKDTIPTSFRDCPKTYLTIFKVDDVVFENQWIEYHNNHCSLQILCRQCNLKKH